METVSLDRFGRIVVPKPMRDELGLAAGSELSIEVAGDTVVLTPLADNDRIVARDGLVVFTGDVLDQIRSGRGV